MRILLTVLGHLGLFGDRASFRQLEAISAIPRTTTHRHAQRLRSYGWVRWWWPGGIPGNRLCIRSSIWWHAAPDWLTTAEIQTCIDEAQRFLEAARELGSVGTTVPLRIKKSPASDFGSLPPHLALLRRITYGVKYRLKKGKPVKNREILLPLVRLVLSLPLQDVFNGFRSRTMAIRSARDQPTYIHHGLTCVDLQVLMVVIKIIAIEGKIQFRFVDLTRHSGLTYAQTRGSFHRLRAKGLLRVVGRGKYELIP